MKAIAKILIPVIMMLGNSGAYAAGSVAGLEKVDVDVSDNESFRRGAHLFLNYCLSCHSAE